MSQQNPVPASANHATNPDTPAQTEETAKAESSTAALADVLAPQGVPYDNRPSIVAERPPKDALKHQKT